MYMKSTIWWVYGIYKVYKGGYMACNTVELTKVSNVFTRTHLMVGATSWGTTDLAGI